MAEEGCANPLAVEHPTGHDLTIDRPVGGDPQEESHRRDVAESVDAYRNGVDVDDGVPGQADTTSFTFDNPNPGATRQFFRVERVPTN